MGGNQAWSFDSNQLDNVSTSIVLQFLICYFKKLIDLQSAACPNLSHMKPHVQKHPGSLTWTNGEKASILVYGH